MNEGEKAEHRLPFQIGVIAILVTAYGLLGVYFQVMLHTDIVYSHFGYIPVVLACMWWGRKGTVVAAGLACALLSFHLARYGVEGIWSDAARGFFYLAVAYCVGALSERVAAGREAVRASEEKYRTLVEKSLAGVFVYGDDRFLFVNGRFGEMMGYVPDRLVGEVIWKMVHEEDRARVQELVRKRKAEGFADLRYECRLVRADGRPIWADVASSLAAYEGRPAVLVNVYDVTDRKEAEEQRRELSEIALKQEEQLIHSTRLAELGEMAASIAHELNQPLTGIRNFARNAAYMIDRNAGGPDEVRENLRLISEQVDRASKIINQMRELTRRTERQFGPVDINETIRDTVEFLHPQLSLSGVEAHLELDEGLPEILGDGIRLEQVFLNLLTNARQAMEESAEDRRLTIRTWFDSGKDCPVVVEVCDTGKGFSPEVADKLFTPFFSTKKPGHGTGLGLSISLRIVKDHQGAIEAKGAPGKGAKFTVRLPLRRKETAEEEAQARRQGDAVRR